MKQKEAGVMGISRCNKQNIAGCLGNKIISIVTVLFLPFFPIDIFIDISSAQDDCTITQVTDTDTVGGESDVWFLNSGTLGGFDSNADVNGDNPDGSFEAYLINTDTFVITQLTDNVGLDSFPFDISAGDNLVSLSSQGDPTGNNPDGNREIFLYDAVTDTFAQITNTAGVNSLVPDITPDGATIGFHSDADLTGSNPDVSLEVFLYDVASDTFTQITDGDGINSATAALSSDGGVVGLNSDTDPTGGNPDNNREIFLFDTDTLQFTQVTDTTSGNSNSGPSVSSDGTRLVFTSDADLTGDNPTQITDSVGGTFADAVISGDGTRILFTSGSDIGGGNPDGNIEVYFADCRVVVSDSNDSGGCALAGEASPRQAGVNAAVMLLVLFVAVSGIVRKRGKN